MALKPLIAGQFYNSGGGGGGDMLKSVYDPANIASQVAGTTVANSFLADQTFTTNIKLGAGGDVILNRKAAATLQLGSDAAGVTNQVITAANRITSDGVGADLTIIPGSGRGAAGGSVILATYDTGASGDPGTLQQRLIIDSGGNIYLPVVSGLISDVGLASTDSLQVQINSVNYKILLTAV